MRKFLTILLLLPLFGSGITPVHTCGFECNVFETGTTHFQTLITNLSISTTTKRSGDRALRINGTGITSGDLSTQVLTSTNIMVARAYVRFATLPSVDNFIIYNSQLSPSPGVVFSASDSKIYAGESGFSKGSTGVSVTTGQWYRIDYRWDGANNKVDVQVDGQACSQFTATQGGSGNVTVCEFGLEVGTTVTVDMFYDDIMLSRTSGDYPIGGGYVNHFTLTSDGTHNVAGANDFERSATGTDITNATTTAYQLIDDVPVETSAGDYILLIAPPNATDYVENVFGPASGISTPTTAPRMVGVIIVVGKGTGTGTNNLRVALNDNGTTDDIRNADVSGTSPAITNNGKFYADPPSAASAWTLSGNGNFNNIRIRCYTSDAAPDPWFISAIIEAEFIEEALTVPGTPSDKRHTTLGVGVICKTNRFEEFKNYTR